MPRLPEELYTTGTPEAAQVDTQRAAIPLWTMRQDILPQGRAATTLDHAPPASQPRAEGWAGVC